MGSEIRISMYILVLSCNQLLDPAPAVEISFDDHLILWFYFFGYFQLWGCFIKFSVYFCILYFKFSVFSVHPQSKLHIQLYDKDCKIWVYDAQGSAERERGSEWVKITSILDVMKFTFFVNSALCYLV